MGEKGEKVKKVEQMKKVSLLFEAGTSGKMMDLVPEHPAFEFIFGLAPEGMTPFEYELLDKTEGEDALISLKKQGYEIFFEHLQPPIMDLFDGRDALYLQTKIVSVTDAGSREIIKAMAEMAEYREGECGCGCSCSV